MNKVVRTICDNDNRWKVIRHNFSRYEYVNRDAENIFIPPKTKRLNYGGCVLKNGNVDFKFNHSPYELADLLLSFVRIKNNFDVNLMIEFIHALEVLVNDAPYIKVPIPNPNSGEQIMSRLININNIYNARKEWNQDEINQLDQLLCTYYHLDLNQLSQYFKCPVDKLEALIIERKNVLSQRPWSTNEDRIMFQLMNTQISDKSLANYFLCRNVFSIRKRRRELKKVQMLKNKIKNQISQ